MEESLALLKNKETTIGGATSLLKKKGSHQNEAVGSGKGAAGNQAHLEADEKWNSLSKKEKQFCSEFNIKPTSYCTLKRQIQFEVAKNRKITNQFLETLQTRNRNVPMTTRNQIPAIYEFMVSANIISPF